MRFHRSKLSCGTEPWRIHDGNWYLGVEEVEVEEEEEGEELRRGLNSRQGEDCAEARTDGAVDPSPCRGLSDFLCVGPYSTLGGCMAKSS
jgi:hypothetical protein